MMQGPARFLSSIMQSLIDNIDIPGAGFLDGFSITIKIIPTQNRSNEIFLNSDFSIDCFR